MRVVKPHLTQPATSAPDPRKRPRESTVSPEDPKTKKPKEKSSKGSNKEEEWVEVPVRKNP